MEVSEKIKGFINGLKIFMFDSAVLSANMSTICETGGGMND